MRQIDLFEQDINKFFEEGNVTKAQLFGAFHRANPNSLDEIEQLQLGVVSSSAWEQKLIGKNIHSVFTWCKDCGMEGINIPFENECGNCGSKNTVRYYDKETIDLLF